ncbi:hypothetical protein Tco_0988710 [Tanacetum coccineum]|uniref:Uncharacterized protein n=1 Tax=Tanacetum coccineum TaxID=301880 RepID=A0ABQ5ERP0_9ASTR
MLNKDNYVPWSSHLLRYAKSKPNGKLTYNSIMNSPYVRRMIPEPSHPDREVLIAETFHEQTDDELTVKEVKQMEADDQAIQIISWQMMKGSDIGIQDKKAKLFNEWEIFTSTDGELIESYYHHFSKLMNDFKRNKYFPEKIASNLKFLNNLQPQWRRHVTIVHQTKDLHEVDYTKLYDFLKYNQAEDSGFELIGFSDVDYAGCKDTFKSTSGGAQFLGEKLVSWSLKKQDCTALSTAKAEYVSLSACCA